MMMMLMMRMMIVNRNCRREETVGCRTHCYLPMRWKMLVNGRDIGGSDGAVLGGGRGTVVAAVVVVVALQLGMQSLGGIVWMEM
jgi:hypothetical protein